jgi:hypothetical protein
MGGEVLRWTGSVIVLVAILVGGCSGKDPNLQAKQFSELLARPDIATAARGYEEIRVKVTDQLTSQGFTSTWTAVPDSTGARSCLPAYSELEVDTEERSLTLWEAEEVIPEEKWVTALAVVTGIVREHGFGEPETVVNRVDDHEVAIRDGYGAQIIFGTAKNTIFRITTGCHLTVAAHQRGTPAPKP